MTETLDVRGRAAADVRALLAEGVETLRDMQRRTGHNRATLQRALRDVHAVKLGDAYPYRFTLPG